MAIENWRQAVEDLNEMGYEHLLQKQNDRYMKRKTYFAGSPRAQGCICHYCVKED